jgi:O-methyltransferase
MVKRLLHSFGLQVQVFASGKFIPLPMWDNDPTFKSLWEKTSSHTLVDKRRCFMLYQYARQAGSATGDGAEVGVYRGGTARLLAKTLGMYGKTVHLFDTFSGMPEVDPEKDLHSTGDFQDTSLSAVKEYLADSSNVRLYPGLFPKTAEPIAQQRFSFVHVDVDIYRSVLDCCEFFYPRLSPGGIMVFDDYGMVTCPGAKSAVDTFFKGKPEYPLYSPTGQAVVFRI